MILATQFSRQGFRQKFIMGTQTESESLVFRWRFEEDKLEQHHRVFGLGTGTFTIANSKTGSSEFEFSKFP